MSKIKKYILLVVKYFSRMIKFFYSYSTLLRLQRIKTKLYTYWISNEFKSFGKNSLINLQIILRGGKYITIGNNTGIGLRGVLTAWDSFDGVSFNPEIVIGDNVSIGEDSHITAINKIVIGNNVLMGKKITITDNSHGNTDIETLLIPPSKRIWYSKGPVIIGNNVWIGDKATILAGVTIGENCIIGANAVVTSNIPPNCVAGGIPAKVIKNCS